MTLRANNELMIRFDRMSEVYANNVEAITAESALYRKELEISRKEVNELQKEIANMKELIQSLSLGRPPRRLAPRPATQEEAGHLPFRNHR